MSQQYPNRPEGGFGTQPSNGPDFAPAGSPHQARSPYQAGRAPRFDQTPPSPPPPGQPRKGRLILVIVVTALAFVLLCGGGVLLTRQLIGGDRPTGGGSVGGELPDNPKIEAPEVINEIAEKEGLTCHDEATSTVKIKGCYLQDAGHLINLRFRITDDGQIDKAFALVLHNHTTPTERSKELLDLMSPLLPTLPLADADRKAIIAAITGTETNVSGETQWRDGQQGRYSYRFSRDTSTVDVGNSSAEFMPAIPLSDNPAGVIDELKARDWTCEEEDATFTCTDPGRGKIMGSVSKAGQPNDKLHLTGFRVWFGGVAPTPDEPRMKDAYAALTTAGAKGEAMSVGLGMLAEGDKHFFNSEVEFYRGDSYYDLKGVQFN